jgi:hypothetical protein
MEQMIMHEMRLATIEENHNRKIAFKAAKDQEQADAIAKRKAAWERQRLHVEREKKVCLCLLTAVVEICLLARFSNKMH